MSAPVPPRLAASVLRLHGAAGQSWIDGLPALLVQLFDQWDATADGSPMHGGTSLVVPVVCAQGAAVIKVIHPVWEAATQAIAITAVDEDARPLLYGVDADHGALLMERLSPVDLGAVSDPHEAIAIAGRLCRRWAVPAPPQIRRLSGNPAAWVSALIGQSERHPGHLDAAITDRAVQAIHSLVDDGADTLIHGDLYEPNVLRSRRCGWVAVDPDPWAGPAAFDASTAIGDRLDLIAHSPDPAAEVLNRIATFALASGVDEQRCRELVVARTSSGVFAELDKGNPTKAAALAVIARAAATATHNSR